MAAHWTEDTAFDAVWERVDGVTVRGDAWRRLQRLREEHGEGEGRAVGLVHEAPRGLHERGQCTPSQLNRPQRQEHCRPENAGSPHVARSHLHERAMKASVWIKLRGGVV